MESVRTFSVRMGVSCADSARSRPWRAPARALWAPPVRRERARVLLKVWGTMPTLSLLIQHLGLALRLYAAAPLEPEALMAHIHAAVAASEASAHEEVTAELLLAMAFIESRFEPATLSRMENKRRVHGRYASMVPPRRMDKNGSIYCGPLQTRARTWNECLEQRKLDVAYAAGARELGNWLRDRYVRGDLTRALAGYGCGYHGVKTGKCNNYPGRVLYQARRFSKPRWLATRDRS